jgi:hypothetical protein
MTLSFGFVFLSTAYITNKRNFSKVVQKYFSPVTQINSSPYHPATPETRLEFQILVPMVSFCLIAHESFSQSHEFQEFTLVKVE